MPPTWLVGLSAVAGTTIIATAFFTNRYKFEGYKALQRKRIRKKLPNDLDTWRVPGRTQADEDRIWNPLDAVFRDGGLVPWPVVLDSALKSPNGDYPLASGFAYVSAVRGVEDTLSVLTLKHFMLMNGLTRVVRTREGHDLTIRVVVIRNEGHDHLKILKRVATGPLTLISRNHALPLLAEFQFEDIIFGLFPKVGSTMEHAFGAWAKNSVGDIMDMVMQALEALAFIHALNIAHRDAFYNNFLVQWQPESMRTMAVAVSRPRVYLIDFEVAVEFPENCSPAERISTGYPLGGSFTQPEMYSRPLAPEIELDHPYCPFKLDVWQFGNGFGKFKTTIKEIDEVMNDLVCSNPELRMSAEAALNRLANVLSGILPTSLLIEPQVT